MNYKNSIIETIGNTPLVRLNKIERKYNLKFKLFAKIERFNPTGSVKDRAAFYMINEGFRQGLINDDTLIIEPTSGNTGIALAMVCAYFNLKLHIYMPENCSKERVQMMKAFGAKVNLTPKSIGMKGSVNLALEEAKNTSNSFVPSQFTNEANVLAHYEGTGKEILEALDNKVDVFLAGFGTGGTVSGVGKRLKEVNKDTEVIGVEPFSSPLLTENKTGPHKIQGIGANFIPAILDKNVIDRFIDIKDEEAYKFARELVEVEGIFAGISSGACLAASLKLDNDKYKDKNVVIILPDNGERYLSVPDLYE